MDDKGRKHMRKISLCLLLIFLCACQPTWQESENTIYDEMVDRIENHTEYIENSSFFSCRLIVSSLGNDQYQYDVIIDQPTINMDEVRAIAIVDGEDSDLFPSIGLEEGDTCYLYPDYVDQSQHYYEGIRLSGISLTPINEVKLYVSFVNDQTYYEQYILLKPTEE